MNNPDERNSATGACTYIVRVYFKTNREHEFPARDLSNARDIAARVTREGCWIVNGDGTEEYFPTHTIHKAKIVSAAASG